MKTAVEWLCENIYTIQRELSIGNKSLIEKINQAKEMEKQQLKDAYLIGIENYDPTFTRKS